MEVPVAKNFPDSFYVCVDFFSVSQQIASTVPVMDCTLTVVSQHLDFVIKQLKADILDEILVAIGMRPDGFALVVNRMLPEDKKQVLENVFDHFVAKVDSLRLERHSQNSAIAANFSEVFEEWFFRILKALKVEPPVKTEFKMEGEEVDFYDWQQVRLDLMKTVEV